MQYLRDSELYTGDCTVQCTVQLNTLWQMKMLLQRHNGCIVQRLASHDTHSAKWSLVKDNREMGFNIYLANWARLVNTKHGLPLLHPSDPAKQDNKPSACQS